MWPKSIKDQVLVHCRRQCCVCHKVCGINIELHHIIAEAVSGESTFQNCIPLCFDCHAHAGHYNPDHPRGTKFSPSELRKHRDNWYSIVARSRPEVESSISRPRHYEGQKIVVSGFVWREAFSGPPNYESLLTDRREVYWLLVLPSPIELVASSPEDHSSYIVADITRLQLMLSAEQYDEHRMLVLSDAHVTGLIWPSMTGHHHGDALVEVEEMSESYTPNQVRQS